ncbi:MAG: radical SAM protein [Fibrobacteria bacterium]|nr:radical SAM protein [Fibrobacteria bacterium]
MMKPEPSIHRARYETFGGIVSSISPPFLAWVDKDFMIELGYEDSPLWKQERNYLSAPTEVHFSVTNQCGQGCEGCYMDSGKAGDEELSTDALKTHFKTLRDMGVFHVALGGGEAFNRPDFREIVSWCKEIGLVPNLTCSGQIMSEDDISICKMMGQVNISLDGINEHYTINGRKGDFKKADQAISALVKAGVQTGINCVVSGKNYPFLEELVKYASQKKLNEVEFLRYKPSGRGKTQYADYRLTQNMMKEFYPRLLDFSRKYKQEVKMDCSFIPSLVWHKPPLEELEKLAVVGCDGGNMLMSVKSNGLYAGCSFVENNEHIADIKEHWDSSVHFNKFRSLTKEAEEPCRSCDYLEICRCGCRAVALHATKDFFAPDPECPKVYNYHHKILE